MTNEIDVIEIRSLLSLAVNTVYLFIYFIFYFFKANRRHIALQISCLPVIPSIAVLPAICIVLSSHCFIEKTHAVF